MAECTVITCSAQATRLITTNVQFSFGPEKYEFPYCGAHVKKFMVQLSSFNPVESSLFEDVGIPIYDALVKKWLDLHCDCAMTESSLWHCNVHGINAEYSFLAE